MFGSTETNSFPDRIMRDMTHHNFPRDCTKEKSLAIDLALIHAFFLKTLPQHSSTSQPHCSSLIRPVVTCLYGAILRSMAMVRDVS